MPLTPRRLATIILFLSVFMMAMKPSVDTDSFWHLRAGAWMLDNAHILTIDVFSYTRLNQSWINHSWLSQIFLALIYRLSGFGGLNLFTAVVIVAAFMFVYRAGRVERRAVRLGETRGSAHEVVAGLSAGEQVVVAGVEGLRDGQRAQLKR